MTLLITVFAAAISTVVWYTRPADNKLCTGVLCWLFWGASLMWFVDAVFEYMEFNERYFTPDPADMLNDTFLGLSVIALALVVWVAVLLIKDPNGAVKEALKNKNKK